MIRLWNRVGKIRAITALVVLAALVGGLVIADRLTQHEPSANPVKAADALAYPSVSPPPPSSDQADAQAKADAAASVAASQANNADDEARKKASEEASRNKTRSATPSATYTVPKYPVPASCTVYADNRQKGCAQLVAAGFGLDQMPCLDKLWTKESGWNPLAHNKGSGAHGIPQALPGSKMGPGWQDNADVQIKWGIGYIKGKYKTPCGAWSYWQAHNFY